MNIMLAYNRTMEKHNVNFSLGINATSSSGENVSTIYRGFLPEILVLPVMLRMSTRNPLMGMRKVVCSDS